MSIETPLEEYSRAMIRGDIDRCISIEKQYGLYGYPPEMVSEALAALPLITEVCNFNGFGILMRPAHE